MWTVATLAVIQTPTRWLLGVVLGILAVLSLLGRFLRERPEGTVNPALIRKFNQRMRAWWLMTAILVAAMLLDRFGAMVLFFGLSFWALREFITMTPTRRGDHRALFWVFFLCTPLQYVLVAMGQPWYGVYSIMIPVYASLFVPARIALSGDPKRFWSEARRFSLDF
jgi:phosphatidate cytidylyltransferase